MKALRYVVLILMMASACCVAAPVMPSIEITSLAAGTVDLTGLSSSNLQYTAFRYKLYSNSVGGFNFSLASLNNGKLVLQGTTGSQEGFSIPFTVTSQQDTSESGASWAEPAQFFNTVLNGVQTQTFSQNTLSIPTGFAYILKINIPKNQKAFRGVFTDTLTFTIVDQ